MARIVHTLAIVHQPPRVLLGRKKRGFGAGKWNGFGGKVRSGESLTDAARRELREEAGIAARTMKSAGMLEFVYGGEVVHEVHLFRVTDFEGEAGESEEMMPCWFPETALPYDRMWESDRLWLPRVLLGDSVSGVCRFNADFALQEHRITFQTPTSDS